MAREAREMVMLSNRLSTERERIWQRDEKELVKRVAAGEIDAYQLSDYHWRVWLVDAPHRALDFWPATGAIAHGSTSMIGRGLAALIRLLKETAGPTSV